MKFVKQITDYLAYPMDFIVLINLYALITHQVYHVEQEELMEFVLLI